ncbi:RimJ/RimL family protein N-acetyltransferase [Neorhizobium galegae]|uniref:GNAT family N-acetyltransferase n=1 Tax=Rhizobium/Agrobacterium group TaxID=227290 RepID=UPI001AE97572|nr:GNAT family N-acetyltransferase [Neorhizobium galegae]MBP2548983.1 RimJ/RimL family protein N-acetyltransferase [Neorhizobium galegae]
MFRPGFDPQPSLQGPSIAIRPLRHDDWDGLFAAAGHPAVWAGHPASDRYTREKFEPYFGLLLESGGTVAVIDRAKQAIIGCSRYYLAPDRQDSLSIGYTFINHEYWGGRTNFELKRLMLDHAFEHYDEVWFHIAPTNIRSQKAVAKLGAENMYETVLNLSGVPAPAFCFRLGRNAWLLHRKMLDAAQG